MLSSVPSPSPSRSSGASGVQQSFKDANLIVRGHHVGYILSLVVIFARKVVDQILDKVDCSAELESHDQRAVGSAHASP